MLEENLATPAAAVVTVTEPIQLALPNVAAYPGAARVQPTVGRDDEVVGGDFGNLATAAAVPHAAPVLVAVAGPDGALAVTRRVPAAVVLAVVRPLHPSVPAAQRAHGRRRGGGLSPADGEADMVPGLLWHVAVVRTMAASMLLDDMVAGVTVLRVPREFEARCKWEVERVAAARLLGLNVPDDVDVSRGRNVDGDPLGDVDVNEDLLLLPRLDGLEDYFLAPRYEHFVRWWKLGVLRKNQVRNVVLGVSKRRVSVLCLGCVRVSESIKKCGRTGSGFPNS